MFPPIYPDHPVVRDDWALYLDAMEYMDAQVGEILDRLESEGIASNTVVIFMGDNGICHLRGKTWLYDYGMRVPLVIRWPGHLAPGTTDTNLLSQIDVTATILDIAGVEVPDWYDGHPFIGSNAVPRTHIYGARDRVDSVTDIIRSVRDTRYKYIRNYKPELGYWDCGYIRSHRPMRPTMLEMFDLGQLNADQALFFTSPKPDEEFYDTLTDPHEVTNLIDAVEHQTRVDEMRALMDAWIADTKDMGVDDLYLRWDSAAVSNETITTSNALAVGSLYVDPPTNTTVTLEWDVIEKPVGGWAYTNATLPVTTGGVVTAWLTGLDADTEYWLRFMASNEVWNPMPSAKMSLVTDLSAAQTPTITGISTNDSRVILGWSDQDDHGTGFVVEYYQEGSAVTGHHELVATQWVHQTGMESTRFFYRVGATNANLGGSFSGYSDWTNIVTGTEPPGAKVLVTDFGAGDGGGNAPSATCANGTLTISSMPTGSWLEQTAGSSPNPYRWTFTVTGADLDGDNDDTLTWEVWVTATASGADCRPTRDGSTWRFGVGSEGEGGGNPTRLAETETLLFSVTNAAYSLNGGPTNRTGGLIFDGFSGGDVDWASGVWSVGGDSVVEDVADLVLSEDQSELLVTNTAGGVCWVGNLNFGFRVDMASLPPFDIDVTPSALDYKTLLTGTTSNLSVDVLNMGGQPLPITNLTFAGADFGKFSIVDSGTGTVAVGGETNLTVQYAPGAAVGTHTATLRIWSPDPDTNPAEVSLQGRALDTVEPDIAIITASPLDFGSNTVNRTRDLAAEISNMGLAVLNVTNCTFTGTDAGRFSVMGGVGVVGAGGSTNITVRYSAAASPGTHSAVLHIWSNDPDTNPTNLALIAATKSLPDTTVTISDFQANEFNPGANADSDNGTVTVANTPTGEWLSTAGGSSPNPFIWTFTITGADLNGVGGANDTMQWLVSIEANSGFKPTRSGFDYFTHSGGANDRLDTGEILTFSVSSVTYGLDGEPVGANMGSFLGFTYVFIDRFSGGTINIGGETMSGDNVDLTFASPVGTLTAEVASGQWRIGNIAFQVDTTALSEPDIRVSPSSLDFGTMPTNTISNLVVTVSNVGTLPLSITNLSFSGTDTGKFSVVAGGTGTVAAGGETNLTVEYAPGTDTGTHTATLQIGSNDPDTDPLDVSLTGTVTAPSGGGMQVLITDFGAADGGSFAASATCTNGSLAITNTPTGEWLSMAIGGTPNPYKWTFTVTDANLDDDGNDTDTLSFEVWIEAATTKTECRPTRKDASAYFGVASTGDGGGKPKRIDSYETLVFSVSNAVYGLNGAAATETTGLTFAGFTGLDFDWFSSGTWSVGGDSLGADVDNYVFTAPQTVCTITEESGANCCWVGNLNFGFTVDAGGFPPDDGDSIDDTWELLYWGSTTNANDTTAHDSDPHSDLQEYIADTDPTDSNSYLRLTGLLVTNSMAVRFDSSTGRVYVLQFIDDLMQTNWDNILGQGPRPGSGTNDMMIDTNAVPKRYYRLEVSMP